MDVKERGCKDVDHIKLTTVNFKNLSAEKISAST